jgi:hypothetical protein
MILMPIVTSVRENNVRLEFGRQSFERLLDCRELSREKPVPEIVQADGLVRRRAEESSRSALCF